MNAQAKGNQTVRTRGGGSRLALICCLLLIAACDAGGGGGSECAGLFAASSLPEMPDIHGAELDQDFVSAAIWVGGFCDKPISITGDGEYSINNGPFTSRPAAIEPGQSFRIRVKSANTYATTRHATVTVGEQLDPAFGLFLGRTSHKTTFAVTTKPGSPEDAPQVTVSEPADNTVVNAESIEIRGTVLDAEGVAAVRVNGIDASTTDGFATWSATVPLRSGPNRITVAATDRKNNSNPSAAELTLHNEAVILSGPRAIEVDETGLRLLVIDSVDKALASIDLVSGEHSFISTNTSQADAPFIEPREFAVDPVDQLAWVIDAGYNDVFAVDLSSGQRELLTDKSGASDSEPVEHAQDIVYDPVNNQLLVLLRSESPWDDDARILAIDPATGARKLLSDASSPGSINYFYRADSLAFDTTSSRLLVLQQASDYTPENTAIFTVDPITGERGQLETDPLVLRDPVDACFDPAGARLLIVERFQARGAVTDLSSFEPVITWDLAREPVHLALDLYHNRVLVLLTDTRSIYAIDLATGEVSIAY